MNYLGSKTKKNEKIVHYKGKIVNQKGKVAFKGNRFWKEKFLCVKVDCIKEVVYK